MTKQRALIYNIIYQFDGHLNAKEIFDLAKGCMPKIVMATVYNNLHALEKSQHIRQLKIYNDADRYDKNLAKHEHLICDVCGNIQDIVVCDFAKDIEKHYDVKIDAFELNLHGICTSCKKSA